MVKDRDGLVVKKDNDRLGEECDDDMQDGLEKDEEQAEKNGGIFVGAQPPNKRN